MLIETTKSVLGNNENANKNDGDDRNDEMENAGSLVDVVEEDKKQTMSYPNETLDKVQSDDESDGADTEKISSSGIILTSQIDRIDFK